MPGLSKHEAALQGLENGTQAVLGVSISGQQVTPGTKIAKKANQAPRHRVPKKDTQQAPTLSVPSSLAEGQDSAYTVIAIDIDAPFVSWNKLSPIMHWAQTDLKVQKGAQELKSDEPALMPWLPAGPPPGAAPHRYVFLLFAQRDGSSVPQDLKGKTVGRMQRMRFDVDGYAEELGLGDIVAVNYFVSN
ncbi:phosphatidylethanolamine-binding protein [Aspergillus aurantiobrunneus]